MSTNKHRARRPDENKWRQFFAPGEAVAIEVGCYFDEETLRIDCHKALDLAFGLGVYDAQEYGVLKGQLAEHVADEQDLDSIIEDLNEAVEGDEHAWVWRDNALFFEAATDEEVQ